MARAVAVVILLALVGGVGMLVYLQRENKRVDEAVHKATGVDPSNVPQQPRHEVERTKRVRITNEDRPDDDSARATAFKELIGERGLRCDRVRSALSNRAGRWTVTCAPGYQYVLVFDNAGDVVSLGR